MWKSISVLVCSLIVIPCHAQPELKGSAAELAQYLSNVPKTATISGEGEAKVAANHGTVTLKISTENKSFQEALRLNQETRDKLLAQLKKQGIPADRVQAAKFSSTPKFGWLSDKAKSYRVENYMKVTVQDEKEFQAVAGAVDTWPEIQFLGMEFDYRDKEAMKKLAIAKACDNATEHQKLFEEKLGVRLVPVRFGEPLVGPAPVPNDGRYGSGLENQYGGGRSSTKSMSLTPMPSATVADVQEGVSPFGELTYTARVTVEYSVGSK